MEYSQYLDHIFDPIIPDGVFFLLEFIHCLPHLKWNITLNEKFYQCNVIEVL